MRRVEAVLGKGWEGHVDGQKLKADGDSFRLKLNTQELFEDWSRKVTLHRIVIVTIYYWHFRFKNTFNQSRMMLHYLLTYFLWHD